MPSLLNCSQVYFCLLQQSGAAEHFCPADLPPEDCAANLLANTHNFLSMSISALQDFAFRLPTLEAVGDIHKRPPCATGRSWDILYFYRTYVFVLSWWLWKIKKGLNHNSPAWARTDLLHTNGIVLSRLVQVPLHSPFLLSVVEISLIFHPPLLTMQP